MSRSTNASDSRNLQPSPQTSEAKVPAVLPGDEDFEQYAGAGLQNVQPRDLLVPRLTILQSLSPQLQRNKPEFIAEAKAGQICDVGTGELFEGEILFLPVYYRKDFLEWAPRSTGRKLIAIHDSPDILQQTRLNDRRQPMMANGNMIAETAQFFGLNLTARAGGVRCFLPMHSTQLKKARRWVTLATAEKLRRADGSEFTAPLWYRTWTLGPQEESNAEGSWFGWKVERGPALKALDIGKPWAEIRAEAIEFMNGLASGTVRGDTRDMDNDAPAASHTEDETM